MADKEQLRILGQILKKPDPWDNWQFYNAVERSVELEVVSKSDLSEHFNMSLTSVRRWLNHKNAPHPEVRPQVFKYLREKLRLVKEKA